MTSNLYDDRKNHNRSGRSNVSEWLNDFVEKHFKIIMIMPLTIVLIGVAIYPFLYALRLSFTNAKTVNFRDPDLIGFSNYASILSSPGFWDSMRITFTYVLIALVLQITIGVGLAILVDQVNKGQRWFVSFLITPMLISTVLVGILYRLALNPSFGVINYYISKIGIDIQLLSQHNALYTTILIDVWQWTSFIFLIAFAGLKSLPLEPFEAAKVYGANGIQTLRYVTLPLLKPVLMIAIIFRLMDAFKAFDHIYLLTAGGPANATTTFSVLTYNYAYRADDFGRASALAILLLIVIIIVTKILLKFIPIDKGAIFK